MTVGAPDGSSTSLVLFSSGSCRHRRIGNIRANRRDKATAPEHGRVPSRHLAGMSKVPKDYRRAPAPPCSIGVAPEFEQNLRQLELNRNAPRGVSRKGETLL